jgi:hypothetical protein
MHQNHASEPCIRKLVLRNPDIYFKNNAFALIFANLLWVNLLSPISKDLEEYFAGRSGFCFEDF